MIERIHLDPKLEKCLAALKNGSRQACLVANRVETIIAQITNGNLLPCALTRNGEARINGCRKYDLGGGYRLITLKQKNDLYLLFAGTHGECSRWIENNREHLSLEMIAERCRMVARPQGKQAGIKPSPSMDTDPHEDWIRPLTNRDLRIVFHGLVKG